MIGQTHKSLRARALLAAGVLSLVVGLFFINTAESTGFTYATESIDLKIDSEASYNGKPWPSGTWAFKDLKPYVDKFWKFDDIKPGDWGENTISLHNKSKKDPLYVCLTFFNLLNGENGINEPESHVDNTPNTGELTNNMEFFAWHDDGDNVFEVGEKPIFGTSSPQAANPLLAGKTYPLYDYKNNGSIPAGGKRYFGVYWCAGDLTVNVPAAIVTCNGSGLGNLVQTDTMKVDVELTAVSAKSEPKFECKSVKPPKPPKPPKGEVCEDVTVVVNNNSTVINNTSSSSNTGGNSAGSGGTVITGNASATSTTTNTTNTTVITTGGSSTTTNIINTLQNLLKRR